MARRTRSVYILLLIEAINHGQVQLACRLGPKTEATFSFGHPRARKPIPGRKLEHVLPT